MDDKTEIHDLIDRLSRLHMAGSWQGDLNPTQVAALGYLMRANRFSRSPSHVAAYLSATRGTVSQTVKSLIQKGYLHETRSNTDRRVLLLDLTEKGARAAHGNLETRDALAKLDQATLAGLNTGLKDVVREMLAARQGRSFGLCQTCRHRKTDGTTAHCALLDVALLPEDADKICYEHEAA